VEPKADDKSLTIYALLDSPRVAGAYKFVVTPGEQTTTSVDSHLFVRKEITKLGIAPLTSMFYHGENTARGFNDFRPEVHDSDGLQLAFKGGEWLWRPLDNKKTLSVSSLGAEDPVGWGLVQRDRDFASYQDLETMAERRPSAWIEPKAGWGKGRVELVEIPTNNELNDNVVTYWVPDRKIQPNEPLAFAYNLTWYGDDPARPPGRPRPRHAPRRRDDRGRAALRDRLRRQGPRGDPRRPGRPRRRHRRRAPRPPPTSSTSTS
jgi:glucans biosynthesis protein